MNVHLKAILSLLLVAAPCAATAMDIQRHHSGSWYNRDQSGHGLSVEVVNAETLVIYWYAYHPDGTPLWLMSVADIAGDTASGEVYIYSGMQFGMFDPAMLTRQSWGTLSLTFHNCNSARLSYGSSLSHEGVPFGSGEIELVRLTFIDGLHCTSLTEGKFGNYSSGLDIPPFTGWPINSFVWIHRDGTLAYQFASDGEVQEIGYGQLTMVDENAFEFDVKTPDGTRQGTGLFGEAEVTLHLGELGVLSEPLDPAFNDAVTLGELAGEWAGPDVIFFAIVDPTGAYSGTAFGGDFSGQLTIPEPGFNQLVDEMQFDTGLSAGANRGLGVYHRDTGYLLFISNREDAVWSMPWYR